MSKNKLTLQIKELILDRLMSGRSLRSICRDVDIPVTSAAVRKAAVREAAFGTQYMRARDLGLDAMAEEMLEIADDLSGDWVERRLKDGSTEWIFLNENVQRSRLRCDVRKWYLSKLAPKRYGNQITHNIKQSASLLAEMSPDQIAFKVNQILENARKRKEVTRLNVSDISN